MEIGRNCPEVVTLIGSTRFKAEYELVTRELTMRGKIVISVGLFGHQEGLDMDGPDKAMLDALHLCKVNQADAVYLVNPGGYCGASTMRELLYASLIGKRIESLEPLPVWLHEMELRGVFG